MSAFVYHTGALGDFITTIPALRFWKNQNRGERVSLLGKSSIGNFAKDIGLTDESLDVDGVRWAPLFSDVFSSPVNEFLTPFTTAILFAAQDSPVIGAIRRSNIQSLYWQPPFPSSREHVIDYHLSVFVDPSTVPAQDKFPTIVPSNNAISVSYDILPSGNSPVALHPGSGSKRKNWPFERFLSIADTLRKKNVPVLWILGPADGAFKVPSKDYRVKNQPLAICAALLSHCRAFVGNDSGITHLAAAVGCPTIALFGPSDPQVWSPLGKRVCVIYKNIPCSPCHRSPGPALTCEKNCLNAIPVEEVFDYLDV